jgi:hypothetical protein
MNTITAASLSIAIGLVASGNCFGLDQVAPSNVDCSAVARTFFAEPDATKRREKFERLELDSQFDVYLCGNQKIHPPTIYLAESLAMQGEKAVPLLRRKLEASQDDAMVRDIVSVFVWMRRLKTFDIASDSSLYQLVASRVSKMKDEFWRANIIKETQLLWPERK